MQQKGYVADSAAAIAQYFEKAALPTQQETLGQVVVEILSDGRNLNRKSLCTKLLSRLEKPMGRKRKSITTCCLVCSSNGKDMNRSNADRLIDQLIGEAVLCLLK